MPLLLLITAGLLPPSTRGAGAGAQGEGSDTSFVTLERLNAGLPRLGDPPDLETPQSTLESFIDSCRLGRHDRAAHALNLNAFAPERQVEIGQRLARELKEVMDQQVWFKWNEVPDRPDGQDDDPGPKPESTEPTGPRSNFLLYRLYIGDHDYEIRLERVKTPDDPPVWVFSHQTVAHIPLLYQKFHAGRIQAALPAFLKERRFLKVALWQWVGFVIVLLTSGLLGWLVQKALNFAEKWTDSPWTRAPIEAIRGPGALTIGLWVFYELVGQFLGLAGPILNLLKPFYVAIVVACLVWFLQRLIRLITARVIRRYEGADSDEANVLITRITLVRHVLVFLVLIGGAAYALGEFEWVRQFGTAILASAGVVGVILGIAAQRVLGNFFSGLLLAITEPVKSGDAIIFEKDFGWIEEISITYLVIRTWDLRRLIIPHSYLMDRPFQNWSRGTQQIIKPVVVFADYRIDVDAVRAELKSILEGSELWDRTVPPILQVTDCKEETIALRALCSARDAASSWDLHCLVRERLIGFIRGLDDGRYLPRKRVVLVDEPHRDGRGGDGADAAHARANGDKERGADEQNATAELQERAQREREKAEAEA